MSREIDVEAGKHRCPRRSEFGQRYAPQDQTPDHWRKERSGHRTCSYCGSLHPLDFMRFAEVEKVQLGPTDKNYKVYVDIPETHPDELRVISAINWDPDPARIKAEGWVKPDPELLVRDNWAFSLEEAKTSQFKWMMLAKRGPIQFGKFYFEHLDEAQRIHFVELMNLGVLNIGIPGRFYRLPFFAVSQKAKVH